MESAVAARPAEQRREVKRMMLYARWIGSGCGSVKKASDFINLYLTIYI
jgi:hypothetical protein